jgi:hypothetical protein
MSAITAALRGLALALPLFLAACDDTNSGTYSPSLPDYDRQEQELDDEQYDEYCQKHKRDC